MARWKSVAILVAVLATLVLPRPQTATAQDVTQYKIQAPHYDVTASYDPQTCTITGHCDVTIKALSDLQTFTFRLMAGEMTFAGTQETQMSFPGVKAEEEATYSMSFRGAPTNYSEKDNRYWCRATSQAVWIWNPYVWLPLLDASYDFGGIDVSLALTLPRDWKAFVPGNPDPRVESSPDSATATYYFDTFPDGTGKPWVWFAGPYTSFGAGQVQAVSYEVWGLPAWKPEAESLAAGIPDMLAFLSDLLGTLRSGRIVIIQIPPEQGGGLEMGGPGYRSQLVGVTPGTNVRSNMGGACIEQLRVHELIHAVANFCPDEGLTEFVSDLYVAERLPEVFPKVPRARLQYVLATVADHGDKPIDTAMEEHISTRELPDWHAYCYSKPALAWNMFRGIYGDEATVEVVRRINDLAPTYDWGPRSQDFGGWWDLCRSAVADVTGESGAAFYDRWFREAVPLDLAFDGAQASRPAPTAGRPEWTVTVAIRDLHGVEVPPARDTIPWVEVGVTVAPEAGQPTPPMVVKRVPLTADVVSTEIHVSGQPGQVILDPNAWLLDYDPSNNTAKVSIPPTPAEAAALAGLALAAAAALWGVIRLARTRPKRTKAPPAVGRAQ